MLGTLPAGATRCLLAQNSDLHVRAPGRLSYGVVDCAAMLQRAVASLLRLPQQPDAVVASGDLTDLGRPEEYAHLRRLLAPLAMPVLLMPGNHDDREALRAAFPEHAYLRHGGPFIQYALDVGALRIVALDTLVPGEPGGRLCAQRLQWLERTLAAAPERTTLLFLHHPPFTSLIGHMDGMALQDPESLAEIIRRHPNVERVLCGHLHRPVQVRFAGTIASSCASIAHQVELNLSDSAPARFTFEPPAFQLHAWRQDSGVVSHTVYPGEPRGSFAFDD